MLAVTPLLTGISPPTTVDRLLRLPSSAGAFYVLCCFEFVALCMSNSFPNFLHLLLPRYSLRCPDTSPVRAKMLYAGSSAALTEVLTGVATKITATDRSEISETILTDACKKFA